MTLCQKLLIQEGTVRRIVYCYAQESYCLDAIYTSVKIIKNEVGCRDDTVPKTVDTRRHCEEE